MDKDLGWDIAIGLRALAGATDLVSLIGAADPLRSTIAVEPMVSIGRDHSRDVKRWRDGPYRVSRAVRS